ncbi:FAD-binding oxidoreductase [Brevundimonas lenta]|uniref:D-lactate dehydrogenase (cytochrome) n=1 Tax=Brevundimonas lenta TaxID=424796 RepID=A0A7W6JE39_9CAUL|nr:FAD-linked oxidase C-terminal domain-containing protein [Brevundimonas lenta]MBB4082452.1 D-lactate dehydrogenase (cytochrome) [Brevundimonas lenta]
MNALKTSNPGALEELAERFGAQLSTAEAVRRNHATVEGFHPDLPPDAVLMARSTDEVSDAVRICARHGLPIIPYGAGSSVEGHVLAPQGGLTIDLSEMNAILAINAPDLDARVQAGVTRKQLNTALRDQGLFFPVDPGADATIGGMVSTRASGTTTVRYGGMRANVMGLTVVLPSGEVITTGGRARKSSAGYDLTGLFTGAEGTLGVITEIQVRLHGIPEEVASAVCTFETLEGAVNTVIDAVQYGLPMARMEVLDALQMKAVNAYSHTDYPEQPTLFLEFHGTPAGVKEQAEIFGELASGHGGGDFQWSTAQEDRDRLWDARHKAYFAALALAPGKVALTTDVCVPVSRLAECILETRADIDASGLTGPILGHVGDGNFHAILLVDPSDADESARVKAAADRLIERALSVGGTCTGEHGVGLGKKKHLLAEQGAAVAVMAAVKRAMDPQNLMNPGKIF